jgi:hypothetical protein
MVETKDQQNPPPEPPKKGMGKFLFPESFQKAVPPPPQLPEEPLAAPLKQNFKLSGRGLTAWRKPLFVLFFIILAVTFFTKDRFKSVDQIAPEVLRQPVQTATAPEPIVFQKAGYSYTLTPLYDYDLTGLVLHRLKYDSWYSVSRTDKLFTVDWCVIWGSNAAKKVYQAPSLSVSQDARFCFFNYSGDIGFSPNELSNNHLLVRDPSLERKIEQIEPGDQVRVRGKLVNVEAVALGATSEYEHQAVKWQTSTTRADTGAGACEIVYVEGVDILKTGHSLLKSLFALSEFGLAAMVLWLVLDILLHLKFKKNAPKILPAKPKPGGG